MPPLLVRSFKVEIRQGGEWRELFREEENIKRLYRRKFPAVTADAVRLTPCATWGGGPAGIFAFEVN